MAKRGSTPPAGTHADDYVRLPDRRYQLRADPDVEISRRQWENLRLADSTGWPSWSAYQRLGFAETAEAREYREFLQRAADAEGRTVDELRGIDSRFSQLWIEKQNEDRLPARTKNRPGGALARFLEGIGLRSSGADYPVGSTPLKR